MNLDTLRVFCDVVSCKNFSRGGAMNDISQSAASQAVHQLERHLGVRLIDRSKRPLLVTPEGQACYEVCRNILDQFDDLTSRVRTRSTEITGVVRVASIYSVGLHELSRCMQDFMKRYRQAKVHLEYLRPNKVYDAVLANEVDLGIVSYPRTLRGLAVIPLRAENMVLVCHPEHRLAQMRRVMISQLRGEKYIAFDRDLAIRKVLDRGFVQERVPVEIVMEFDNIETIKQAIEIGEGVSILPQPTVRQEVRNKTLVAVPLAIKDITRPIGIIHRKRKLFTPAIAEFVELLRQVHDGKSGKSDGSGKRDMSDKLDKGGKRAT